jgi:hypothetical protein
MYMGKPKLGGRGIEEEEEVDREALLQTGKK